MIPTFVEIQGEKELATGFYRLDSLFSNLRPVFEKLRDKFFPLVQKKFDSGGPGWEPLSPATEAQKAKRYGGPGQILVATKALYNSFAVGAAGSIERIRALEAEFGSSVFYGVFHQEGRGVPERKIIDITTEQESQLIDEASDVLSEKVRSFGFEIA